MAAARAWAGDPNLTAETVAVLTAYAANALAGCRRLAALDLPRPAPERAAPPDPVLPRLRDELTMPNCGCNDYSRTQALRRAAAEAGRGLPAIEPGMPLPAGTGLTRRSFVSRATGLALSVYGAASLGPRAFEQGIAAAAAQAPSDRVLVSIFLSGGADSLSMLAPTSAHPRYAERRPTLALAEGLGTPLAEDPSLRWHPSLAGLAELHGEGKVSVLPAIGYDDANQSHFTSRHYWEVGETNPFGRWGWLGRYLDEYGTADNPLQGLTLGWDLQPSLAARDVPVATVSPSRTTTTSGRRACGARCRRRCSTRFADLGDPRHERPRARRRARRGRRHRPPARPARPVPVRLHHARRRDLPGRRLRAPAARARRDAGGRAAAEGGGDRERRLRHALEPGSRASGPTSRRSATACGPSSATSRRACSRTACSCTCGASSAGGRRRTARAPTTARPAPAS